MFITKVITCTAFLAPFVYSKETNSILNDESRRNLRGQSSSSLFQWPVDAFVDDLIAEKSNDDNYYDYETTNSNDDTNKDSGNDSPTTQGDFKITLMHMGTDTTYNKIFEKAAKRWEKIIVGGLPDVPKQSSSSHSWFGTDFDQMVNVDIDDVLIGYEMEKIDGKGDVLGYAGPVYSRKSGGSISAISGIMKFDKEDFADMPADDIELIIIHEMGHVLGIGTFWDYKCGTKCAGGASSYTCNKAQEEYKNLGYSDELKLQSNVCGHWSEGNFGYTRDEIMTPFFDEGRYQPISRITTAALFDLGYEVNFQASDNWDGKKRMMTESEDVEGVLVASKSFVVDETVIIKPKMLELN